MNKIDFSKYENIINKKRTNKNNNNIKNYFINAALKILVVIVILLSLTIIYKSDSTLKDNISKYIFEENISFTKMKKLYDKYLGGILPVKKNNKVTEVFNEKLNYSSYSVYHDGIKLSVGENYLVPSIEEGMVVFIGNKDNYGNTIIIENLDGIHYWYGNIANSSLKLYDYVEKGYFIGEANSDLYMVFSKDGNYLDYEEYIY